MTNETLILTILVGILFFIGNFILITNILHNTKWIHTIANVVDNIQHNPDEYPNHTIPTNIYRKDYLEKVFKTELYSFYINNTNYFVSNNIFVETPTKIGTKVHILVNPENFEDFHQTNLIQDVILPIFLITLPTFIFLFNCLYN